MATEAQEELLCGGVVKRRHHEKFLDAVVAVYDECKLHITPDGWSVDVVDPANVFLANVSLSSGCFIDYDGPKEEAVVGVPAEEVENLTDGILASRYGPQDPELTVSVDRIKLSVKCGQEAGTVDLLDPEAIRDEPDIAYDVGDEESAIVRTRGTRFKASIDETIEQLPDDRTPVEFRADADTQTVSLGYEDDGGDPAYVFHADEVRGVSIEAQTSTLFSSSYLEAIADAIMASPPVWFGFGEDFPLFVQYPIAGGWQDEPRRGQITFRVAPRIRQDGDGG